MKVQGMVFVLLLALFVAGCSTNGNSSSTASITLKPTVLHALRPERKDFNISALDHTVQDAAVVQRLFAAAYKLPTPPSGRMSCPNDIGLVYQLDFLHDRTLLQHMSLQATGCGFLLLNKNDVRVSDYAFQVLLSKTIGIPSLVPGQSHP